MLELRAEWHLATDLSTAVTPLTSRPGPGEVLSTSGSWALLPFGRAPTFSPLGTLADMVWHVGWNWPPLALVYPWKASKNVAQAHAA